MHHSPRFQDGNDLVAARGHAHIPRAHQPGAALAGRDEEIVVRMEPGVVEKLPEAGRRHPPLRRRGGVDQGGKRLEIAGAIPADRRLFPGLRRGDHSLTTR